MKEEKSREHYLFVCTGSRCRELTEIDHEGASVLQKNLKSYVKEQGWKDKIRIGKSGCLGSCETAPNVMFQPENRLCSDVSLKDEQELRSILKAKGE
jgi:NADH:ubiquinone oxidoreductase subunit E